MTDELLEQRVAALEARLGTIEQLLQAPKPPSENPKVPFVAPPPPPPPKSATAASPKPSAGVFNGSLLGFVGVIFFILSAAFFIKLAVTSGWLTPERQVIGAFLFGLSLVAAGLHLRRTDAPYAGFLSGAGVVVLYLAVYGGHLLYGLYPGSQAAVWVGLVTIGALALFNYQRSDFFLIVAVLGTYFVPLLLRSRAVPLDAQLSYFVLWDLFFCGCAYILRRRNAISFAAYAALGLFQFLAVLSPWTPENLDLALWTQAGQFALFSIATALYSVRFRVRLTVGEAWSYFLVLLFFYGAEYQILLERYPGMAAVIAVLFAGAVLAVYSAASKRIEGGIDAFGQPLWLFLSIVFAHAIYGELVPEAGRPWVGLALLVGLGGGYAGTGPKHQLARIVLWMIVGLEYCRAADTTGLPQVWPLFFSAAFAVAILAGYLRNGKSEYGLLWLLLGSLQALISLHRAAHHWLSGATAEYATSALWAAFALAAMIYGTAAKRRELSGLATGIFCLVALKVLLSDIASSSSIVRVIALLVVGTIIFVGGLVRRKEGATPSK